MKKIYTVILAALFAGSIVAQQRYDLKVDRTDAVEGRTTIYTGKAKQEMLKELEDAFFTEDFANGFAGNNEANASWSTDSDDGISEWEYRGPNTDPDTTVGSRGSCAGATTGIPCSETLGNGFMIFDSNWWDDPSDDCGVNVGTGLAPGPQTARLTSTSLDLSAQGAVQVFFTLSGRPFAPADLFLAVSVDGGPFTPVGEDIFDKLGISTNDATPCDQLVGVDISEVAAGQSDVRIQFLWDGDYYYASIDDIYLDTPPDVDLEITSVQLDDDLNNPIFRYREIPGSQNHVHTPGATIRSNGLLTGDVTLTIDVFYRLDINDPNPVPFTSGSVTVTGIERDSTFTAFVENLVLPDDYGNYLLEYTVTSSAGDDALPGNNMDARSFDVVKNFWADEDGRTYPGNFFQAFYTNGDDTQPFAEVTVGQTFYTFRDNPTGVLGLHTILPNFTNTTTKMTEGQFFEIELFRVTDRNTFLAGSFEDNIFELLTSSEFFPVESDFATASEETINIEYDDAVTLMGDEYYVATIKNSSGEPFNIGVTGTSSQDGSGLIRGAIQAGASTSEFVRYTNVNPYIKLVIDSLAEPDILSSVEAYNNNLSFTLTQNTPNPANEFTTIAYNLENNANVSLEVIDITGKAVMTESYGSEAAGNHFHRLDISNLNAGIYYYRLNVDGQSATRKMVVTR